MNKILDEILSLISEKEDFSAATEKLVSLLQTTDTVYYTSLREKKCK